jgi:hypothetical protein
MKPMSFDPREFERKVKKVAREAGEKKAAAVQGAFDRVFKQHANGEKATIEAALTTELAKAKVTLDPEKIARFGASIANGKPVRVRTDLSALE